MMESVFVLYEKGSFLFAVVIVIMFNVFENFVSRLKVVYF